MAALTAALLGLAAANTIGALRNKAPKPPALPPVPNVAVDAAAADADAARAETMQRTRAAGGYGRRATLLTGPAGITAPPPVPRKTLLGQ